MTIFWLVMQYASLDICRNGPSVWAPQEPDHGGDQGGVPARDLHVRQLGKIGHDQVVVGAGLQQRLQQHGGLGGQEHHLLLPVCPGLPWAACKRAVVCSSQPSTCGSRFDNIACIMMEQCRKTWSILGCGLLSSLRLFLNYW